MHLKSVFTATAISFFFCSFSIAQKPFVKISGEVVKPLSLYAEDLAKMKQTAVSMKGKDSRMHRFTGVSLTDILEQAGAATGKQLHGENMTKYMMVKCADGYRVLFSLVEFDSSFTDRRIILVSQNAGKPLPATEGPFRLVVSGEKKPARSCRQVTEVVVGSAKE